MPLGTEVDLGPGDIVLDGDPAPPWKGAHQPPNLLQMARSHISAIAGLLFSFPPSFNVRSLFRSRLFPPCPGTVLRDWTGRTPLKRPILASTGGTSDVNGVSLCMCVSQRSERVDGDAARRDSAQDEGRVAGSGGAEQRAPTDAVQSAVVERRAADWRRKDRHADQVARTARAGSQRSSGLHDVPVLPLTDGGRGQCFELPSVL